MVLLLNQNDEQKCGHEKKLLPPAEPPLTAPIPAMKNQNMLLVLT